MYNNIGMYIGHKRKNILKETKFEKYSQSEFIKFGNITICTQPKLSLIENGRIKIPNFREYELLINNLGFKSVPYFELEELYNEFSHNLLLSLQYQDHSSLLKFKLIFEESLSKFNDVFYINDVNEILSACINAQLGISLPNSEFLVKYLDAYDCFPENIQILILDTSNLIIENYFPLKNMRIRLNTLIEQSSSEEPLMSILKAGRNVRQLKLFEAQDKLAKLKNDDLNDLMKFRIERLLYMVEIDHTYPLTQNITTNNPSLKYLDVNRFERCRPYSSSATIRYTHRDFNGAIDDYEKAISINDEAACFNMIYITDCLHEMKRIDLLGPKINIARKYTHQYSRLNNDVISFFEEIYEIGFEKVNYNGFGLLFESLAQLNSDSPYVMIVRKHLLNYVGKNHRYKLIYDFDMKMQNSS
jgi:hypothetical protein